MTLNRTLACCLLLLPTLVRAGEPDPRLNPAIERGLKRLELGSASYIQNRQCFSCHHQALTLAVFESAKQRGFQVPPEKVKEQLAFTLESFAPKKAQLVKGQGVPGGNTMTAYALFTLDVSHHPADETTAALVEYLLVRQRPDGSWPALANRPPSEGSSFTNAALALRGLKVYEPGQNVKDAGKLRERIDRAFAKGRDWLLASKPKTTEDKMFRLRGLVTAGVDQEIVETARRELLQEQRADGGWSQLPDLQSDAYATGAVLLALRQAGIKPDEPAFQKGIAFLLKTQNADGSWIVQTRSRPVQTFFDNGDPGGKSQFISFLATGWATLALLEATPVK